MNSEDPIIPDENVNSVSYSEEKSIVRRESSQVFTNSAFEPDETILEESEKDSVSSFEIPDFLFETDSNKNDLEIEQEFEIKSKEASIIFPIEEVLDIKEDGEEKTQPDEVENRNSDETGENKLGIFIVKFRDEFSKVLKKPVVKKVIVYVSLIIYALYFITCIKINNPLGFLSETNSSSNIIEDHIFRNNKGLGFFVVNFIIGIFILWDKFLQKYVEILSDKISQKSSSLFKNEFLNKHKNWIPKTLLIICLVIYFVSNLESAYNCISLVGLFTFIFICILISKHPSQINWNIIINGILTQFVLGTFVLRSKFGFRFLKFFSDQVTNFLDYTDAGSSLVFGKNFKDHYFAFKACAVIIFFSAMINLFYYFGVVQYIILKISWLINKLIGTSPTESVNATANIFIGQTEAPLIIKPFLDKMTQSEIFAMMVGGFASAAGSTLAAYIGFGVPVNHVIIASLLAAPGSLIVAKTVYPETRKATVDWELIKNLPKGEAYNLFEAISVGATSILGAIGGILSNLIAFTAFFTAIDSIIAWFFSMINLNNFGITGIFQYLFWPFAFLMGVSVDDCKMVSKLIGIKIFVNEFVAYSHLGKIIETRKNLTSSQDFNFYLNGTYSLPEGTQMIWHERSIVITTYALCGFANFASVGLQIACLSSLAPTRAKLFPKIAALAMLTGNISNFINACIAGVLYRSF